MSDTDNDNPFAGLDLQEDVSAYDDIKGARITNWAPPSALIQGNMYTELEKNVSFAQLVVPNKNAYAAIVGGVLAFEMIAKEGNNYNWLEAFAAAEAHRARIISLKLTPTTRGVGQADIIDAQGRPFDVKTPYPGNVFSKKSVTVGLSKFSVKKTIQGRLNKGGYDGYPAVLIVDVSFLTLTNLTQFRAKVEKHVPNDDRWRVIEVAPDYTGSGYVDYNTVRA